MLILTTPMHVLLFGALALDLGDPAARMLLLLIALPVLVLHGLVWASARFVNLGAAMAATLMLNGLWAVAGWGAWALRHIPPEPTPGWAADIALEFFAAGLLTTGFLVAWVHIMRRRRPAPQTAQA